MSRFEKMHPFFQLIFFSASLIIPLTFNNPFFSAVSLFGAVLYSFVSNGKKAFKTFCFSVLVIVFVGLFNMLFAHYGEDVLFKIKDTEFTFEALFYGFHQGMIVACVFIWFSALGRILDSERIIYLFRFVPKCALIFSMVLGFIPRFLRKLEDIKNAQTALRGGEKDENLREKFNSAMSRFSALISYSMESSMITADSMTARNYNPKAVRAGRFKMLKSELALILSSLLLILYIIIVKINGDISFVFEPKIYSSRLSMPALIVFFVFEMSVSIIDLMERLKWKLSTVKA